MAHHFWIVGTATTLRATIAYVVFLVGMTLAKGAIRLLPKDHPGRIYAQGRLGEGAERIRRAVNRSATDRYISIRRRPPRI